MGWVVVAGTAVFGAPRFLAKTLETHSVSSHEKMQNRGAPKTAVPTTTHPFFPEKSGQSPGVETPWFSFSHVYCVNHSFPGTFSNSTVEIHWFSTKKCHLLYLVLNAAKGGCGLGGGVAFDGFGGFGGFLPAAMTADIGPRKTGLANTPI